MSWEQKGTAELWDDTQQIPLDNIWIGAISDQDAAQSAFFWAGQIRCKWSTCIIANLAQICQLKRGPPLAKMWHHVFVWFVFGQHVTTLWPTCGPDLANCSDHSCAIVPRSMWMDESDTVVGCGPNLGHSNFAIVTLFSLSFGSPHCYYVV